MRGRTSAYGISAAARSRVCGSRKGYGSFNKDFRPDYTPARPGSTASSISTSLISSVAPPRWPSALPVRKRRFVIMEVAARDADVVGYESIIKDGAAVGYVTSGAYGTCIGKSLAAGYVPTANSRATASGSRSIFWVSSCRATIRLQPLYDPKGLLLRG